MIMINKDKVALRFYSGLRTLNKLQTLKLD